MERLELTEDLKRVLEIVPVEWTARGFHYALAHANGVWQQQRETERGWFFSTLYSDTEAAALIKEALRVWLNVRGVDIEWLITTGSFCVYRDATSDFLRFDDSDGVAWADHGDAARRFETYLDAQITAVLAVVREEDGDE